MDIQSEKLQLIHRIIQTSDEQLLRKIDVLLSKSGKKKNVSMSLEAFFEKIDASEKAFEENKTISHSELKDEIKKW
ncbi:MAG: hypothetical protein IEMM0006_0064 [bacterium]|nr:MAG: hypothetical protein IEMM0006_0064 [bacterium]